MKYKLIDNKIYGTTHVFRSGRKNLKRRGLPPREGSRWGGKYVRGTNLIGEPYDQSSGKGWSFYKWDWVTHLTPWEKRPTKWKDDIIKKSIEEWETRTQILNDNEELPF